MIQKISIFVVCEIFIFSLFVGCNGESDKCTVGTSEGCIDGLVCAEVVEGEPACFEPVQIQGNIFDAVDSEGIFKATIVALDANGGARTETVFSNSNGTYILPVLAKRTSDGKPIYDSLTLRGAAAGYQAFPLAPRTALPIDISTAVQDSGVWVVQNAATDLALIPLTGGGTGLVTIRGMVDHTNAGGVLVVAEQSNRAVSTAITDNLGSFVLFNVPSLETQISGYRAGLNVTSQTISVSGSEVNDVVLSATTDGLSIVNGSVNIVNAPGGSATNVLLVIESTFDSNTARGESPAGLRAGNITNAFSIADVPPGKYVVLAAFENDGLVRDPDESIGGTDIVTIEVTESSGQIELSESFKVTEALGVVSPGANGIEVVNDAEPTFIWKDDSSEDGYEVRVYNAFGELVHENTEVPKVTGDENVSYKWTGALLEPGMIYQFRATSWRESKDGRTYISATEDLMGVFEYHLE